MIFRIKERSLLACSKVVSMKLHTCSAFLLLLLVLQVYSTTAKSDSGSYDAIIIGAGMSGIMAAKTLSKHGINNFIILEATDRIGGRMKPTKFGGKMIELGANWVEGVGGEKVNPIWTLAKENNLSVSYSDYSNITSNIYAQDGRLLSLTITTPHFDLATTLMNFSAYLGSSMNAHGEEDISVETSQRIFGHVPSTPLEMALDYYNYDFEYAEPPRVTSLKNVQPLPTFEYYGEDVYFVSDQRGYSYITEQLAKGYLSHDNDGKITDPRLQLNKVVREIKYYDNGVHIRTEDNSTYHAKYAIISVSLGVLKSQLIDFKPDLPYWKLKTIYQFDMAIFTKIFLKFPYTFWPIGPGTEFFLYADDKRGYYPVWKHLENQFPGTSILVVFVSDDESKRIEQQPDETTEGEIFEVLRKMFGNNIPDIEEILIPRWWKDRFYRGCYSNWPIGVTEDDFDRMKAPIGPLYFTGEHTSAKFNGYVHGAYLAGIATTQTLIDCINLGDCKEITPNTLPWETNTSDVNKQANETTCKGECCKEAQQERESIRQVYLNAINDLQDALEKKCPSN